MRATAILALYDALAQYEYWKNRRATLEFLECSSCEVPPDHYAVTDSETWATYPKKYCRNAKIVKCRICGKPATHVDAMFPMFDQFNLCDEHYKAGK